MLRLLKKTLAPPIFEDEDKTRAAQYLNAILNAAILLLIAFIISGQYAFSVNIAFTIMAISLIGMHFLMRGGKVDLASILFVSIMWIAVTYLAWVGEGVRDLGIIVYIVLIFLSSILGNTGISIGLTVLSVASAWTLFYAETKGFFIPVTETLIANTFTTTAIFVLIETIIYFTVTDLEKTLLSVRKNEKSLITRNDELVQLQENLQKHAFELEKISKKSKRQTARLETITEVSQAIALTQDLKTLLPEIARRISEGFNFYHVGVFSVEDGGDVAKLQATNSVGGQKMLEQEYQIRVKDEQENFIARVMQNKKHLVVFDITEDHICSTV